MRLHHLLYLLGVSPLTSALLEQRVVSFESTPGSVPLHEAAILYAEDDPVGVRIASESLAQDLEQITGNRLEIIGVRDQNLTGLGLRQAGSSAIIAGTVNSALIQALIQEGKVSVSDIEGKWESFQTSVVTTPFLDIDQALVIAGSDKRAVMFGLYTLAEQSGQSPFHWWADVPAAKHDEVYAVNKTTVFGEPSVKYRGLFMNDEAPGMTGWWSKTHGVDHQPLDSEFYRHVFDMLLRLKGNFMWPAMWKSYVPRPGNIFFTDDPDNIQLAHDYGVVVSTSHHEPMQRATNEWDEATSGSWNWETNKDRVAAFMNEGIHRTDQNESYYTLGMRGPTDGPIPGDDPIGILRDVFATQRSMLSDYYGNITHVNQVWTIYKEVMTYYAAGLVPPEDVTLMFTDDNWGNIQRLPTPDEAARPGGIGMYYHLEYLGIPKAYKWQNTNNIPKVYKELYQAYERGVDRIWVINIGDIKPLEMPFSFVMEMAYNMSSITFDTIPDYFEAFATREFGPTSSSEIASIIMEQSRLIGRRKYESVQAWTYSVLNYQETERVLVEWRALAARVRAARDTLPEERKHAFWHHIEYPIISGYYYYEAMLGLGINQHFGLERRNSANAVAQQTIEAFEAEYDLIEQYDSMLNGKWAGILAQPHYDEYSQTGGEDWKEPTRDVITGLWYVQLRQNSTYAFGNLGIFAENTRNAWLQGRSLPSADSSAPTVGGFAPVLPRMDPYGKGVWNIDLFHRGDYRIPIEWDLEIPYDWIRISPSSGELTGARSDQRLNVTIDWDAAPADFDQEVNVRINFDTRPHFDLIRLRIRNYRAPADFAGFPEASGMISIEGPHYQRASEGSGNGGVAFEHIPHLGTRSNSGSLALRPYGGARADRDAARAAWAEYDIYLYGEASLSADVYVNGALDTDPTLLMEYSLTLDGAEPRWARLLGDPGQPGDTPPGWRTAVADHVWIARVDLGRVSAGVHTLRWMANSPEVYLEKIAVNTRGGLVGSYLGPPETTRLGGGAGGTAGKEEEEEEQGAESGSDNSQKVLAHEGL